MNIRFTVKNPTTLTKRLFLTNKQDIHNMKTNKKPIKNIAFFNKFAKILIFIGYFLFQ